MANKSSKNQKTETNLEKSSDKSKKNNTPAKASKDKNEKPGFGTRVKKFFAGLRNELKLVVWPDRKQVKETTIAVLVVVVCTVIVVFIIDQLMTLILGLVGFNTAPTTSQTIAATTSVTQIEEPSTTSAAETTAVATTTAVPTIEVTTTATSAGN